MRFIGYDDFKPKLLDIDVSLGSQLVGHYENQFILVKGLAAFFK
jgi:hypothetical protein